MSYIPLINLIIWSIIAWIYVIKPRLTRYHLQQRLKLLPEFKTIEVVNQLLTNLYKDQKTYVLARDAAKKRRGKKQDLIYGEIEIPSFALLCHQVAPTPEDVFYDLGCGSGKAVLMVALSFNIAKACGVELLSELYSYALEQKDKAYQCIETTSYYSKRLELNRLNRVEFFHANFLEHDFSQATILFVNATCIQEENWEKLLKKIRCLKIGSRIILTSKTINDPAFQLQTSSQELMSWGMNSVSIYLKIS